MRISQLYCCLLLLWSCARVRVQDEEVAEAEAKAPPALEQALSRSSRGLVAERGPDGSTRVDLQGRFSSATILFRDSEGRLQRQCIDHPAGLAALRGERR